MKAIIEIILVAVNTGLAAFVWYYVGRHKSYSELLDRYETAFNLLGKSEQLREAWKMKYRESRKKNKLLMQRKEAQFPWLSVNDELPPMDEEVIALSRTGRISFAHIVDRTMAKDYDGWNIPDVAFWMSYRPSEEMKAFYEKAE